MDTMEHREPAGVSWHDIIIAGKQFNIASRYGEAHIRDVERCVEETIQGLMDRVEGQNALNRALLAALNLADRLVTLEMEIKNAPGRFDQQLRVMLTRIMSVLPDENPLSDP